LIVEMQNETGRERRQRNGKKNHVKNRRSSPLVAAPRYPSRR
jgi:hypothetical protein